MITIFKKYVIQGLLLLSNILNAVKIEQLVIPELIQIGNVSEITLDCHFKAMEDEPFIVEWFYNDSNMPIYQWSLHSPPKVNGILVGRLDPTLHVSSVSRNGGSHLRIVRLDSELSGEYTCRVESNGTRVQQTKAMLVFTPERELDLKVHRRSQTVHDVFCTAHGVFPPPDLVLENKNQLIPKQQQRIWRSGGDMTLYDAESVARLDTDCPGTITCRLMISEAGYMALKEKTVHTSYHCKNQAVTRKSAVYIRAVILIILLNVDI